MKKQIKKGFTLVELLVVIAIIAILSVVSVVGYTSFTKKAKVSNDLSLTTQMNNILQAEETSGTKLNTPHDAIVALEEGGLDVTKLTPTTDGYIYVYNTNGKAGERIVLLDEKYNVKVPEGLVLGSTKEDYFAFVSTDKEITKYTTEGFSIYVKNDYSTETVNVSTGFDIGDNTKVLTVNYTTTASNNVVIRTNDNTTLNVNAANSSVKHYEAAKKVNIEAVAANSFHEYGKVTNIEVKAGRVAVESGASVQTVVVTGNSVKVDSVIETVAVKVASTVTTAPEVKVAGVTKTATSVNLVDNLDNLVDGSNVVLNKDIEKQVNISAKNVTIDMNGHTIKYSNTVLMVKDGGIVKLQGTGLIKSTTNCGVQVCDKSTLELNDVTIEAQEFAVMSFSTSVITINSGTYTAYDNAVLGTNGTVNATTDYGHNTITINGGVFNGNIKSAGYIACGIYAANSDTWNVNGGTFNIINGCGILARSGVVNVSKDVTINLNNDENNTVQGKVGDSKVKVISGASLVLDNAAGYPSGAPTINNSTSYNVTEINKYN